MNIEKAENLEKQKTLKTSSLLITNPLSSLKNLLLQALTNKDIQLLKFIIHNQNKKIIKTTLENFTEKNLYKKFLKFLIDLLEGFPSETKFILNWLNFFFDLKKKILVEEKLIFYLEERSFFFQQKICNLKKKEILHKKLNVLLKNMRLKEKKIFSFGRSKIFIDETKKEIDNKFLRDFEKKILEKKNENFENLENLENEEIEEETLSQQEEKMLYEYENKIHDQINSNKIAVEDGGDGIDIPDDEEIDGDEGKVVEDDDGEGVRRY